MCLCKKCTFNVIFISCISCIFLYLHPFQGLGNWTHCENSRLWVATYLTVSVLFSPGFESIGPLWAWALWRLCCELLVWDFYAHQMEAAVLHSSPSSVGFGCYCYSGFAIYVAADPGSKCSRLPFGHAQRLFRILFLCFSRYFLNTITRTKLRCSDIDDQFQYFQW